MRRRLRFVIATTAALVVLAGLYFEPTHCVRGWLHGEAFFDGRPASWWRSVIERDLHVDPLVFFGQRPPPPLTSWQRTMDRIGWSPTPDLSKRLIQNNKSAGPVLRQLQDDPNEKIAGFATDAQKSCPPQGDSIDDVTAYWMVLVGRYSLRPAVIDGLPD